MSDMVKVSAKTPEVKKETKIAQTQKTDFSRSTNSPVDRIMFFQRTIGNQAVQGLIRSGNLHAKPQKGREAGKEAGAVRQIPVGQEAAIRQKCKECDEVQGKEKEEEEEKVCKVAMIQRNLVMGSPGDIYEQEAERVAEEVSNSRILSMGNTQQEFISKVNVPEFLGLVEIRGKEISSRDENGARRLRISADCGGSCQEDRNVSPSLENRILQSKGSGSALPMFIRKSMELQTGYDFSNVRVKTDSEAAQLNRSLGARAFTNGSDIWLGRNESVTDVKLMAHELTHVVQQGAAKRISPKSVSVNGIRSKSKVLGYLQAMVKSGHSDSSVYHSDILQFQRENSPDKIMAMQQQILETPNSSINHKENSGTLRGCIPGCTPSSTPCACHVKSGPTYTPSGTIPVTTSGSRKTSNQFNMAAEFHNDTPAGKCPRCCEVRQYIKWDAAFATQAGGPPHSGFPSSTPHSTWIEDRDTSDTRYGHRSGTHSAPIAGCGDEYLTGSTRDMANGDKYCGKDRASGLSTDTGSYNFQLKVIDTCNGNAEKASSSVITINW